MHPPSINAIYTVHVVFRSAFETGNRLALAETVTGTRMIRRIAVAGVAFTGVFAAIVACHAQRQVALAGASGATTTINRDQIPPSPPPLAATPPDLKCGGKR
jgi:hypothetical protein